MKDIFFKTQWSAVDPGDIVLASFPALGGIVELTVDSITHERREPENEVALIRAKFKIGEYEYCERFRPTDPAYVQSNAKEKN